MTAKFGPDKPQFPLEPLHVYYISSNTPTTTSCSLIKRTSLAKQKPLQELFNPGNAPRIPGFCIHPPAQMLTFSNPHLLSKHLSPPSFKNLDFPPSKQYPPHGLNFPHPKQSQEPSFPQPSKNQGGKKRSLDGAGRLTGCAEQTYIHWPLCSSCRTAHWPRRQTHSGARRLASL